LATENRTQDAGHARFNISTKNKTESAQEFGRYRRFVSKASNNNANPGTNGNTGGKNIRGQYCKKSEHGQQKNDADGTPIICECRNGNKVPHWYAK